MEREIIFRGKRKDNGEWVYGGIAHKGNRAFIVSIVEYRPETRDWHIAEYYEKNPQLKAKMIEVDPATVGQYTGLTDRNGKKIFDGDIITYVHHGYSKGVVKWDKETASFIISTSIRTDDFCLCRGAEFEVIGNRWDDPELLEVRK